MQLPPVMKPRVPAYLTFGGPAPEAMRSVMEQPWGKYVLDDKGQVSRQRQHPKERQGFLSMLCKTAPCFHETAAPQGKAGLSFYALQNSALLP